MPYTKRVGDLQGRIARDLPLWCDLSIKPFGNPARAEGTKIHVVWKASEQGLFYSEHAVKVLVEAHDLAAYATFDSLQQARIGWYLGPVFAGGPENKAVIDEWVKIQDSLECGEVLLPIRPKEVVDLTGTSPDNGSSSNASSDEDGDESTSSSSDDDSTRAAQPEPRRLVTSAYYLLKGMPLAPAGPHFPSPVVYAAHLDALTTVLAKRKRCWWIVARGKAPGVYDTPYDAYSALGPAWMDGTLFAANTSHEAHRLFVKAFMADSVQKVT